MSSYQRGRHAKPSAGRRRLVTRAVGATAVPFAALLALAAPAAADAADYLYELEVRHAAWTAQELLDAGYRACSMMDRGIPASEVTDRLDREMGFGVALAFDIASMAVIHLDC
ncbi:DUF732 domain-containing protein [Mycobacterium pyrenivorans]|nr:DUF732 domain-containing protein [Mycolicibacterium pyrenivorans]